MTINANTVTASNGPTMKYHCTVVLAEKTKAKTKKKTKKKKTKTKQNKAKNKKIFSHYGTSKHEEPEARQVLSLLKFIFYPRLSKENSIKKKDFWGYSCHV